jgi:hypothetical protein
MHERRKTIFEYNDYVAMKHEMSDTREDTPIADFIAIFEKSGVEFFFVHELRVIIYYMRAYKGLPGIPISGNKDDLLERCNKFVYMQDYKPGMVLPGRGRATRKSAPKPTPTIPKTKYDDHIATLMQQFCQSLTPSQMSERGSA